MNKKQFIVICLTLLATATPLYAFDKHPIDIVLDECLAKNTSTQGMRECGEESLNKWDAEMNKYYTLLQDKLQIEAKERLKESQSAWLKFRDSEFKFIDEGYFIDMGSYIAPTQVSNKVDIVKARALELKTYYDTINE